MLNISLFLNYFCVGVCIKLLRYSPQIMILFWLLFMLPRLYSCIIMIIPIILWLCCHLIATLFYYEFFLVLLWQYFYNLKINFLAWLIFRHIDSSKFLKWTFPKLFDFIQASQYFQLILETFCSFWAKQEPGFNPKWTNISKRNNLKMF